MVTVMQNEASEPATRDRKPPLKPEDQHDPFMSRSSPASANQSWERDEARKTH